MPGPILFNYVEDSQRAFDAGRERKRKSALEQLAGDYFAQGQASPEMLSGIARNGGDALAYQRNDQAKVMEQAKQVGQYTQMFLALSPEAKQQAYPELVKRVNAMRLDHPPIPEQYDPSHDAVLSKLADVFGRQTGDGARPMNVSPGGAIWDPTAGREVYRNNNFAPQRPTYDSARGGWAIPPTMDPTMTQGAATDGGDGFVPVAAPLPDYRGAQLDLARQAAARADQAAKDAAEARRRASFGTAPPGQRFNDSGSLEDIPGYRPKAATNGDAAKGAAGAAGLKEDAYAYAASDTGVDAAVLRQMTPQQVRDLMKGKPVSLGGQLYRRETRWMTGPITGRIPGAGMFANPDLEAYRSSAAGKQARINNPTGPVTNADFQVGEKSVWGPDKPDEVNADLIYNALSRTDTTPQPATSAAPPKRATEGQIIVNPQTGERRQLRNGQWQRINP